MSWGLQLLVNLRQTEFEVQVFTKICRSRMDQYKHRVLKKTKLPFAYTALTHSDCECSQLCKK